MPHLMFELITKSYIRAFHPLKIEISTMIFHHRDDVFLSSR